MTSIGESVGGWLYIIAAALAFGEAALLVGLVLPGETALLVAGYFCHQGTLRLEVMIPVAIVAAIAGDSVGYEIGERYGPRVRGSRIGQWVGESRWDAVDAGLVRHGGKAVFFARLTALLRALTPFAAGMSKLPFRTFIVWNAAGGVLWGGGVVLLGWAFGSALSTVASYLTWAPIAVIALVAVAYLGWHLHRRRRVTTG